MACSTGQSRPCSLSTSINRARVNNPTNRPSSSSTGKSCCGPANNKRTASPSTSPRRRLRKSVIIACRKLTPRSAAFTCTISDSPRAPMKMNMAMKMSSGCICITPISPPTTANPCPIAAATRVATV